MFMVRIVEILGFIHDRCSCQKNGGSMFTTSIHTTIVATCCHCLKRGAMLIHVVLCLTRGAMLIVVGSGGLV